MESAYGGLDLAVNTNRSSGTRTVVASAVAAAAAGSLLLRRGLGKNKRRCDLEPAKFLAPKATYLLLTCFAALYLIWSWALEGGPLTKLAYNKQITRAVL